MGAACAKPVHEDEDEGNHQGVNGDNIHNGVNGIVAESEKDRRAKQKAVEKAEKDKQKAEKAEVERLEKLEKEKLKVEKAEQERLEKERQKSIQAAKKNHSRDKSQGSAPISSAADAATIPSLPTTSQHHSESPRPIQQDSFPTQSTAQRDSDIHTPSLHIESHPILNGIIYQDGKEDGYGDVTTFWKEKFQGQMSVSAPELTRALCDRFTLPDTQHQIHTLVRHVMVSSTPHESDQHIMISLQHLILLIMIFGPFDICIGKVLSSLFDNYGRLHRWFHGPLTPDELASSAYSDRTNITLANRFFVYLQASPPRMVLRSYHLPVLSPTASQTVTLDIVTRYICNGPAGYYLSNPDSTQRHAESYPSITRLLDIHMLTKQFIPLDSSLYIHTMETTLASLPPDAALFEIAKHGDSIGQTRLNEILTTSKSSINAKDTHYGRTALMYAASHGHVSLMITLLDHGANIDAVDNYSSTALMYACREGRTECVNTLIQRRCAIDTLDKDGRSALMFAVWSGHGGCVRLLLKNRARTDACDWLGHSLLDYVSSLSGDDRHLLERSYVRDMIAIQVNQVWSIADIILLYAATNIQQQQQQQQQNGHT